MAKFPKEFEITIERLHASGAGLGVYNSRKVLVFGALPGERVKVYPTKVRRNMNSAGLIEVMTASGERREAKEEHFLSCSPWQIMPEETQLSLKCSFAKTVFMREMGRLPQDDLGITPSPRSWGYRNKMEFSFGENAEGRLSLALHKRNRRRELWTFDHCALAADLLNTTAQHILQVLETSGASVHALKNLIVRYSEHEGRCVGALYVMDEAFPQIAMVNDTLVGFTTIYSDPQAPAARATNILFEEGRPYLDERIGGNVLRYRYDNFFQVNPPAFESLLTWVEEHMAHGGTIVDLYAGVGTIGIALAGKAEAVRSLELDRTAAEAIMANAERNGVKNIVATHAEAAEKHPLTDLFFDADTLIVDPPRSGMHPKAIQAILSAGPRQCIYVSCNPETQARDYKDLCTVYEPVAWRLFDLYPQTPHVESVIIMHRR